MEIRKREDVLIDKLWDMIKQEADKEVKAVYLELVAVLMRQQAERPQTR